MVETILIVGCGVFGLSTALELSQNPKYKIIAIDKYPIPSPYSASNDYNKIVRAEYSDIFYSKLSVEALQLWENNPLYKDVYFKSGRLTLSPDSEQNQHRKQYEQKGLDNLKELNFDISGIKEYNHGDQIGEDFAGFKQNSFKDINATYNPNTGYGHSAKSLLKVYNQCVENGVNFIFGSRGTAIKILSDESIQVESGEIYKADKILLSLGASTGYLVDLDNQIRSLGLYVTHIKLNDIEYEKYKDIPIFFSSELGYFFPPDVDNYEIKIALTYADTDNIIQNPHDSNQTISLPRYKIDNPNDTFPINGEIHVRNLLRLILPELQNHKLIHSKVCWISDTSTSDFLIDKLPNKDKIIVATGDSGHGYKFLPNIGKYIALKLQDKLNQEFSNKWKWKSNPNFPQQFATRSKREHLDIKNINDWYIEDNK
ncbi:hypothetical protein WICMUC_005229 [Wickerhamomyces mucosus]|uniref:FAD dependent oxidoreductase domain-containing protein n=1 Tax=Wickerhamomyces mucosus TaxID=1378264 RepID=A0A9P8PAR7_9ASCO|nr:hypothetical protein WICMUC_005229 [Wickerhamomyces mucosus]